MKKLFVSLCMNGRPDEEVMAEMQDALKRASAILDQELELIDQLHKDDLPKGAGRCWMLGESLQKLDQADYICFAGDWWNGKGTRIEHMCAEMYAIPIIFEDGENNNEYQWASNEVYLAIKDAGNDEVTANSFKAALKGFQEFSNSVNLNNEEERIMAIAALRQLTNRLPLTAVGNDPEDWENTDEDKDGNQYYVHRRLSTLFKMVQPDGNEKYVDTERVHCIDVRDKDKKYYHGGLGETVFNRLVPINFPYYPQGKFTVYTEEFQCHEDANGPDTFGVIGFRSPEGETAEVMQFFKKNHETNDWDYIQKTEYASRLKKAAALMKKNKEDKNAVSGQDSTV